MQNYLLYNASEGIHSSNECRYALLKLLSVYNLKPPQNISVVVQTGQPRLFDDFFTFFPQFEIRDPVKDGSNAKKQIIQDFFSNTQGNLLICDTSTFPLKPIEHLFHEIEKGLLLLYRKEPPQKSAYTNISGQVQALLSRSQHKMNGLHDKGSDISLFNSAITGLNHSVLHIAFQKQLPTKTANDYFADYFELSEFRKLLHTFFTKNEEESIPSLVKLANLLDVETIRKEKITHNQLPLWKKWWHEITGKGWSIRKYEKRIS